METVKEKAERVLACIKKLKEVGEATSFELISRYTNIHGEHLWEVTKYLDAEGLAEVVSMSDGQQNWYYLVTITRGIEEDEVSDYF